MSLPLESPPAAAAPPPPAAVYREAYRSSGGGGSVGPVIAVLAVIAVLGVMAGIMGRLCFGRRIWGYGQYDLEGWVERKCHSCIDGWLDPPPPPPVVRTIANGVGGRVPAGPPRPPPQEGKEAVEMAES